MAYTAVPTVSTGDLWTAANQNTYLKDNMAAGVPDIFTAAGQLAVASAANAATALAHPAVAGRQLTTTAAGVEWDASEDGNNVIINGDMEIAQRGTTFAAAGDGVYTLDRMKYYKNGAMVNTVTQDTDVPTFSESGHLSQHSLKVDCTTIDAAIAAGDYNEIGYKVEGYDYAPMKEKTVTLSFWVKSTKTGTFCVGFLNNGSDRSYVVEYVVDVTNTWEKKEITLTLDQAGGTEDYTDGKGFDIRFVLASGATYQTTPDTWQTGAYFSTSNQVNACDSTDNNFLLSQLKLEIGDRATPFRIRGGGHEEEVALCQRYWHTTYSYGTAIGNATTNGAVYFYNEQTAYTFGRSSFPVRMRTTPTIVPYAIGTGTKNKVRSNAADETVIAHTRGDTGLTRLQISTVLVVGKMSGFHFTADAEL